LADARNSGIGQPVRRKEDLPLVTAKAASATTSICPAGLPGDGAPPHAHARIASIDVAPALAVARRGRGADRSPTSWPTG